MYARQQFKTVAGKRRAYWAIVESVRTERGPRQKVVSWLGALDEAGRLRVLQAAQCPSQNQATSQPELKQQALFEYEDEPVEPRWVQVNTNAVCVENCRQFGGPWLALKIIEQLKLDEFLNKHMPKGKEAIQCVRLPTRLEYERRKCSENENTQTQPFSASKPRCRGSWVSARTNRYSMFFAKRNHPICGMRFTHFAFWHLFWSFLQHFSANASVIGSRSLVLPGNALLSRLCLVSN